MYQNSYSQLLRIRKTGKAKHIIILHPRLSVFVPKHLRAQVGAANLAAPECPIPHTLL